MQDRAAVQSSRPADCAWQGSECEWRCATSRVGSRQGVCNGSDPSAHPHCHTVGRHACFTEDAGRSQSTLGSVAILVTVLSLGRSLKLRFILNPCCVNMHTRAFKEHEHLAKQSVHKAFCCILRAAMGQTPRTKTDACVHTYVHKISSGEEETRVGEGAEATAHWQLALRPAAGQASIFGLSVEPPDIRNEPRSTSYSSPGATTCHNLMGRCGPWKVRRHRRSLQSRLLDQAGL
jgi:hypothetical protein